MYCMFEWSNRLFQDKYMYKYFAMITKPCNNHKEKECPCFYLATECHCEISNRFTQRVRKRVLL